MRHLSTSDEQKAGAGEAAEAIVTEFCIRRPGDLGIFVLLVPLDGQGKASIASNIPARQAREQLQVALRQAFPEPLIQVARKMPDA